MDDDAAEDEKTFADPGVLGTDEDVRDDDDDPWCDARLVGCDDAAAIIIGVGVDVMVGVGVDADDAGHDPFVVAVEEDVDADWWSPAGVPEPEVEPEPLLPLTLRWREQNPRR
jgi:hypothetical protein